MNAAAAWGSKRGLKGTISYDMPFNMAVRGSNVQLSSALHATVTPCNSTAEQLADKCERT